MTQLTADQRLNVRAYEVRQGDSMNAVARRFHTTSQELRELNYLPRVRCWSARPLRVPSDANLLPAKRCVPRHWWMGAPTAHVGSAPRVVVRRGETLWAIARKHGVDVNALALMNGMQPNTVLRTGQRLRLSTPYGGGGTASISTADDDSIRAGSAASSPVVADSHPVKHTVHAGDTLFHLAQEYGVSVAQVASWNRLSSTRLIPGQQLLILQGAH